MYGTYLIMTRANALDYWIAWIVLFISFLYHHHLWNGRIHTQSGVILQPGYVTILLNLPSHKPASLVIPPKDIWNLKDDI